MAAVQRRDYVDGEYGSWDPGRGRGIGRERTFPLQLGNYRGPCQIAVITALQIPTFHRPARPYAGEGEKLVDCSIGINAELGDVHLQRFFPSCWNHIRVLLDFAALLGFVYLNLVR